MKMSKLFVLALVFLLAFVLPVAALAGDNGKQSGKQSGSQTESTDMITGDLEEQTEIDADSEENTELDADEEEAVDEDSEEGNGPKKEWQIQKRALMVEKQAIAASKEAAELLLVDLEAQYEVALAAGDTAAADALALQIEAQKAEIATLQTEMKAAIEEMQGIKVFAKDGEVKFDAPPVIKEGRLLIPLRAIATATGAQVSWDSETKTITIEKDGTTILVTIGENSVLVNGEEKLTDVPAEISGDRTVVPLRFIVENLGLKAEYDPEAQTVGIE